MVSNVSGWAELMNSSIVKASFQMYDTATGGFFIVILFFLFNFMLFIKTRSLTALFVADILFISLTTTIGGIAGMPLFSFQTIALVLIMALALIITKWFTK